jgi:hypothetical protein
MLRAVRTNVRVHSVRPACIIRNDGPLDVFDLEESKDVIALLLEELYRSFIEDQETQI